MPAVAASPWLTQTSPHFQVYYTAPIAGRVDEFVRKAEADYSTASEQLGMKSTGSIRLYLYAQHRDFRRDADIRPHDLVVGVSEVKSGQIRLDASDAFSDADRILMHEVVHSVLARGMGGNVDHLPLWMNEGLAQVVGQPDNIGAEERIRNSRGEGTFLRLSDLSEVFPTGEAGDIAYAAAYSGTAFFLQLYGWDRMRHLLQGLKEGNGFTATFRNVTGAELTEFYAGWEDSLVRRGFIAWMRLATPVATSLGMIWASWMAYRTVRLRRRQFLEEESPVSEEEEDAPPPQGPSGNPTLTFP